MSARPAQNTALFVKNLLLAASLSALSLGAAAQTSSLPITGQQRATADRVAQAGVPLSELAADAPDSHTVKAGDT
ncbi:MAG: peptidoglycan-binding protein, partial [Paucibacter sp.]|nr:peptidoglycan-binding protein [Roseateles sp.]